MRAWIEINCHEMLLSVHASPSSRGRGLKFASAFNMDKVEFVALFMRAWIEITWNILLFAG